MVILNKLVVVVVVVNLWAPNAEFHVIYCIQIIQLLLSSISLQNIFFEYP